jgi:hypothetical protein
LHQIKKEAQRPPFPKHTKKLNEEQKSFKQPRMTNPLNKKLHVDVQVAQKSGFKLVVKIH